MGRPHPNPGKARGQRARASLAPGDRLPACRRQAERKRLDANRMVLGCRGASALGDGRDPTTAAAAAVPSPAATPNSAAGCRRHRLSPRAPISSRSRVLAAIPSIHQHNPARQTGRASRPDLLQRNLRLGEKPDRLGDAGRGAARGIGGPLQRQIQAPGDRQARRMIGQRQADRDLAVVLLAELAAILTRHPDRVTASHGHVRGQGSGLEVHGSSPAVGSDPRSEPVSMTRWYAAPDQAHIRSPLVAAAPTSRIRRVGLRRPGPFFQSASEASRHFGSATWIRQD